MSNVFRLDDTYVDKPKRNVFDLSFQNNLTLKMGKLVPVFCKEVLPGDSFKIDTNFGLKYLPQVFPVQTRQRASVKFYYVRNRPLWKDWMDFVGKTKSGLTSPYLKFGNVDSRLLRPSSIADYMGIPVFVKSSFSNKAKKNLHAGVPNFVTGNHYAYLPNTEQVYSNIQADPFSVRTFKSTNATLYVPTDTTKKGYIFPMTYLYGGEASSAIPPSDYIVNSYLNSAIGTATAYSNSDGMSLYLYRIPLTPQAESEIHVSVPSGVDNVYAIVRAEDGVDYLVPCKSGQSTLAKTFTYRRQTSETSTSFGTRSASIQSIIGFVSATSLSSLPNFGFTVNSDTTNGLCWCDINIEDWPFCSDVNPNGIRINALPFRAIQSVYNALIRNAENNPYLIDGVPEYNKYIRTDEGGATTPSDLLADYYCNWSDDRFTTALPSPQQGNAPLVGLTGVQGATLTTSTNDGTTSTLHLKVDSSTGNVMLVDGVSSDAPEYLNDAMMSAVEYGITINDLRNVNAFQRWLENNIRRGYKYKDQLMSHYGVSARFDVLDMPEFIGGVTRDVDVQQITQTTQNEFGDLGEYAGQSYVSGSGHSIEKYCDEHGFIIGIMSVYPMPIYQDAIPKHLLKSDAFDYYFPEFGKIGPQPITKKEIAFSQSFLEGNMDETFGYQRAWYDYLESIDEVHGLYHSDFRNFLIARDFAKVPTLGSNFLTIDSDDVNNTFYSDDDKDKILGQLYFKTSVKRCIPLIGIPSIE